MRPPNSERACSFHERMVPSGETARSASCDASSSTRASAPSICIEVWGMGTPPRRRRSATGLRALAPAREDVEP